MPDDFCGKNPACARCEHCPEGKPEPVQIKPVKQVGGDKELKRLDILLHQLIISQQYPKV